MKILIANPPWPGSGYGVRTNSRWPHKRADKKLPYPIYLAYAIAILKKEGFEAYGIDAVVKEYGISKFVDYVKKIEPNLIVLEISAPSLHYDLETAASLKKELPNSIIAFCGPYVTVEHKNLLHSYNFIDIAIIGEFDITIKDIALTLKKKQQLKIVNGISFKDKYGRITTTSQRSRLL